MIDAGHLKLMRGGAVLISTSRGKVVDHKAFLNECRTRGIVAAIDVTEPKPLPPNSPFRKLKNAIVTPTWPGRHICLFLAGNRQKGACRRQASHRK